MNRIVKFFFALVVIVLFQSCLLFESPKGDAEIVSIYKSNIGSYKYISVVVKITNNGNKNIYNTTLSIEADSNINSYYKTSSSNQIILPEKSIYLTFEFSINDKNEETDKNKQNEFIEEWNFNSVKILDVFFD